MEEAFCFLQLLVNTGEMKKSRFIKTAVALFAFLLILLASLYFLRPAYREIDGRMRQAESRFLADFSESTGLGLSYDSISPSILSGITIRNIRVYDFKTGEDILTTTSSILSIICFAVRLAVPLNTVCSI